MIRFSCVAPLLALAAVSCAEAGDSAAPQPASNNAAAVSRDSFVPPKLDISTIHFTDCTAESGIEFTITAGRSPASQIVEVKGGGLALIDFDADGDLDLFVPNGATLDAPDRGPGCRLFENLGGMKFQDVTAKSGLAFNRWAMGAAVGDIDADGLDDIFIACFGRNAMLKNLGGGRFADVTEAAGLIDDRWSTAATFGDIDADGDLDLYVVNYLDFDVDNPPPRTVFLGTEVFAGPNGLPPQVDVLYENLGDGTFRDITEVSGCAGAPPSFGLGAVILDFDGDGRQDIFVGNDSMRNFLFRNLGEKKFEEIGQRSGIGSNADGGDQATMGIAIGDVDANGRPDVFTTNFSNDTNTLHLNLDGRFFDDRTQQFGLGMISQTFLGWATMFFDFDHDADEDLLVFNGHVYPHATRAAMNSDYLQPPLLFERVGRRFERATGAKYGDWLDESHCDRSAVFGDLDQDGDIDVIVGALREPIRVLRNDAATILPGGWLIVELHDARPGVGNHRGIGAKLTLKSGDLAQTRWIFSGGSFQSASMQAAHFGLGEAPGDLHLEIRWPDGHDQQIENVKPNQRLIVTRN